MAMQARTEQLLKFGATPSNDAQLRGGVLKWAGLPAQGSKVGAYITIEPVHLCIIDPSGFLV